MRTPRKKVNLPAIRSLKIQPKIRLNKYSRSTVPEIKLCGAWLAKAGFTFGKRVRITSMSQVLVIQLEE